MDFSVLEERVRNSYRYITKNMAPDNEDDCVQEVLLSYWQNGKGQTVDQAVIDFLRKYGAGRKGSKGYDSKLMMLNASELSESLSADCDETFDFDICKGLDGRVSEIAKLYGEGYTLKEIGEKFGISESRCSQIFRDFTEKMQIISILPRSTRRWVIGNVFKS